MLERTLRRKLGAACTAEAALELLASCHLNRYDTGDRQVSAYLVTRTAPDQARILRALRLQHLADDEEIAELITLR